jgi:hypothetical protein
MGLAMDTLYPSIRLNGHIAYLNGQYPRVKGYRAGVIGSPYVTFITSGL